MSTDSPDTADAALVRSLLAQNRAQLLAIANSVVQDPHEAEDIVQDTIAAVWRRLPVIAPEKVAQYLSRSVKRNATKRRVRRREFATDKELIDSWHAARSESFADLDPLEMHEMIETLPIAQRNVIRMKYYMGMTYRQIGDSLSISSHTAASRCRYALEKMRQIFNQ